MRDRGEDKVWDEFTAWCRARRLRALPAHPWTVAAYLRWGETRWRLPVLHKRLEAILRGHLKRCQPMPDSHGVVARTLRLIEFQRRQKKKRSSLFRAADFLAAPAPAKPRKPRRGLGATPPLIRKGP